jgi:3-hydroxy-3-methylglutaryl CoA synthase
MGMLWAVLATGEVIMSKNALYILASIMAILVLIFMSNSKPVAVNEQAAQSVQPSNGAVGNTVNQAVENAQKAATTAIDDASGAVQDGAQKLEGAVDTAAEPVAPAPAAAAPVQAPTPTEGQ